MLPLYKMPDIIILDLHEPFTAFELQLGLRIKDQTALLSAIFARLYAIDSSDFFLEEFVNSDELVTLMPHGAKPREVFASAVLRLGEALRDHVAPYYIDGILEYGFLEVRFGHDIVLKRLTRGEVHFGRST